MPKFLTRGFVLAGMLAMAACGGGGDDSKFETPGGNGNTPPPVNSTVASISMLTSSPTILSASNTPIDISAYAKDANNALVKGATVTFSATSGQVAITQAVTDENGLAKATLTAAGDPSNREITVSATAGSATSSLKVNVSGTQLTLNGPNAMVMGQQATFNVRMLDSANAGIGGRTVSIASARNNTLSASTLTTDSSGNGTFTMTIANTGSDTVTATSLGMTATVAVSVSSDSFAFTTPNPNTEIALNTPQTITVKWLSGGNPVAGQSISFASTRGAVSAPTATTDSQGVASVTISSTNSGKATLTASGTGSATAQLPIEFVATSAATVDVQPTLFTMAPNQESTLTATVRDPNNNLVKNKVVTFSLQDITGGTLSTASAVTDSLGRAQSTYKAGPATSASDGVHVTATVQGTAVTDTINLTVAQAQLFISLGTGNELEPLSGTQALVQYSIPYVVQITDANGNGVANVSPTLKVLSLNYLKGYRKGLADGFEIVPADAACPDEDRNHNGVLDTDPVNDEDDNGSGRIEAGNIATVYGDAATTDAKGFMTIHVVYPKEYADWLEVQLDVRAGVSGTEFVRSAQFWLPGAAADFDGPGAAPGMISPFGVNSCGTPN